MKKNFKKSKFVILPALATLVLTGVASVTGTVTWFTANRAVSATSSSFQANNLTGGFTIKATGTSGLTSSDAGNATTSNVFVDSNALLADASYNISSDKLFTKILEDDGTIKSYKEIGAYNALNSSAPNLAGKTKVGENEKNVFYALTWSYTFTFNGTDQSKNTDLFIDTKSAQFTYTADPNKTADAAIAFRIGFIGNANSNAKIVLGNNDTNSYVSSTSATANYSNNYIKAGSFGTGVSALTTDNGDNTERPDYIRTFTPEAGKNTITVNCIAWFEGTDTTNVNNEAALSAVSARYGFYVRDGGAYTASK